MKYLKARELIEAILNEANESDTTKMLQDISYQHAMAQHHAGIARNHARRYRNDPKKVALHKARVAHFDGHMKNYEKIHDQAKAAHDAGNHEKALKIGSAAAKGLHEAILNEGDPNSGDGNMKKYGGTRANKLVSQGMGSYGVTNPKTGKPVRTLGKLHKRLAKLSPEDLKRYRNQYGIRTGSGRLYPQP